jgi:hypothetical protein
MAWLALPVLAATAADGGHGDGEARGAHRIKAGVPKRSANRPNVMPPAMKPVIVRVGRRAREARSGADEPACDKAEKRRRRTVRVLHCRLLGGGRPAASRRLVPHALLGALPRRVAIARRSAIQDRTRLPVISVALAPHASEARADINGGFLAPRQITTCGFPCGLGPGRSLEMRQQAARNEA